MSDLISRQTAIDDIETVNPSIPLNVNWVKNWVKTLPSAQPELLTDKEQRIFLAAMGREEKICKQVDKEWRDYREPYEDSLVRVCHEITRKVKAALSAQPVIRGVIDESGRIEFIEQPERKTGRWRHYEGYLTCSECRTEYDDDIMTHCCDDVPKFCPNCGARMEEQG